MTMMPSSPEPRLYLDPDEQALQLESLAVLRAVEQIAATTLGPGTLMMRAAQASAQFLLDGSEHARPARVHLFAGPGNNGGDALCTAIVLRQHGVDARVCLPLAPRDGESLAALHQAREAGVPIDVAPPSGPFQAETDWYVDGLFGIGLNRGLTGHFAMLARDLSAHTRRSGKVLALDVPSGLDAANGQAVQGNDGDATVVEASHTLSFLAAKPGLFTGRGRDVAGRILLAPLGIDAAGFAAARGHARNAFDLQAKPASEAEKHARHIALQGIELSAPSRFMPSFPQRRASAHKGTFGSIAIVGGDTGTCGAAILAARAALYSGAGRIHAAMIGSGAPPYDPPHPEIMLRAIDAIALETMDAIAIGPGLGQSSRAQQILRQVIEGARPTLIDADALNLIASHEDLAALLRLHGAHTVITPHPGEASRLLKISTRDIEADRIAAAMQLSATFHCTTVLKGSGTIIATHDGRVAINATGNAGLATGGSGDVLSGVIGAFLAQHVPPFDAALAGCYLHGKAAEYLSETDVGPVGLTAGELAPAIRLLLNRLYRQFGRA